LYIVGISFKFQLQKGNKLTRSQTWHQAKLLLNSHKTHFLLMIVTHILYYLTILCLRAVHNSCV